MQIAKAEFEGQHSVIWNFNKSRNKHTVTYGEQVRTFSGRDFGEVEASHEYGECVAHAARCAELLDR